MFCLRLSHSGKAFHFSYANQTQESFLDGHVRAFEAFGGVPKMIRSGSFLRPRLVEAVRVRSPLPRRRHHDPARTGACQVGERDPGRHFASALSTATEN